MTAKLIKNRNRKRPVSDTKAVNLYRFIRLILGPDITDTQIARRWHLDTKNFAYFKTGRYPVPRLRKLEELAVVLGINKHLVFQVAGGTPADKVFTLIINNDLEGQMRLLFNQPQSSRKRSTK